MVLKGVGVYNEYYCASAVSAGQEDSRCGSRPPLYTFTGPLGSKYNLICAGVLMSLLPASDGPSCYCTRNRILQWNHLPALSRVNTKESAEHDEHAETMKMREEDQKASDQRDHSFLERDARDDEFGGSYGFLDYDLNLDKKAEKGCILNSRITWFFSNAYTLLKDESLLG